MLIVIQKNVNIMLDLLPRRRILIISEMQQVISPNVHQGAQFHILKYDVRVFTRAQTIIMITFVIMLIIILM